jgi:glyoxylase-like metal-dependent hydrolase (beta-lactamase superfamily II)
MFGVIGYEEDWDIFRRRLRETSLSIYDIGHLFLTHHLADHAGFVNELVANNPAISVAMSEATRGLLVYPAHRKACIACCPERDLGKNRQEDFAEI